MAPGEVLSYEDVSLVSPDHWSPETRPIVLVTALSGDAAALQKRIVEQFPDTTILPKLRMYTIIDFNICKNAALTRFEAAPSN